MIFERNHRLVNNLSNIDRFMSVKNSYKFLMMKPVYIQMLRRMNEESDKGDTKAKNAFLTMFTR